VFFPFGLIVNAVGPAAYTISLAAYVAKVTFASVLLATVETVIAKMRVFRVPNLLGIALMLGSLGTLLLFVSGGM
jgi:formate hydrogenlyase subunit 4